MVGRVRTKKLPSSSASCYLRSACVKCVTKLTVSATSSQSTRTILTMMFSRHSPPLSTYISGKREPQYTYAAGLLTSICRGSLSFTFTVDFLELDLQIVRESAAVTPDIPFELWVRRPQRIDLFQCAASQRVCATSVMSFLRRCDRDQYA